MILTSTSVIIFGFIIRTYDFNVFITFQRLVIELSPNQTNSKYIGEQLNRGPAVVLFLPLKQRKTSQSLLNLVSLLRHVEYLLYLSLSYVRTCMI